MYLLHHLPSGLTSVDIILSSASVVSRINYLFHFLFKANPSSCACDPQNLTNSSLTDP